MQLITAIIRPTKVAQVCEALQTFAFQGLTVIEATGLGKLRGRTEIYRGARYCSEFENHHVIEIVVPDEDVRDIIEVIRKVAATGRMGDGKIWTTPVGELVRIRTGEAGSDAL